MPAGQATLECPLDRGSALAYIRSSSAGVTQLVECQLPKLNVASSNLVARSRPSETMAFLGSLRVNFPSPVPLELAEQVRGRNEDPRRVNEVAMQLRTRRD